MNNIDSKIQLLITLLPDIETSQMEWITLMIEGAYKVGRLDKQIEILEAL